MSYEADARRQLISRLRNVYGSQADAYRGAALDDAGVAQQKALMKALESTRRAGVRTAKRCPPGNNKLCVDYACVPRAEAAQYRRNARALRVLNRESRSRGQKAAGESAWITRVRQYLETNGDLMGEDKDGKKIYRPGAWKAALKALGTGKTKAKKTKKAKRGRKAAPSAAVLQAAADIVQDIIGPVAAPAAASSRDVVVPPGKLGYQAWGKTGGFKDMLPGQRMGAWLNYLKEPAGSGMYYPNYGGPGYGAGRSGGVMMDSMYGEGYGDYGGVLMDVFDDYQ